MDVLAYIFNVTLCNNDYYHDAKVLPRNASDLMSTLETSHDECSKEECFELKMEQLCAVMCCARYCCQQVKQEELLVLSVQHRVIISIHLHIYTK